MHTIVLELQQYYKNR